MYLDPTDLALATPVFRDNLLFLHVNPRQVVCSSHILRFLDILNRAIAPLLSLTSQSFRSGFVRLAFIRGVPIWQTMHHGDWKTLQMALSYAEDALIPNPLGGISGLPP
mgnify:CR=1 FL=1